MTGISDADVVAWKDGVLERRGDRLIDEVPVALVFNGISHAVMLASPTDLDDFALGFALSEGIVAGRHELYGVDVEPVADGIEVRLAVAAACEFRLKERRRSLAGRTGCGLCGTESLAQVMRTLPPVMDPPTVEPDAIRTAFDALLRQQPMQRVTGAAHAAAWCDEGGGVSIAREDVGRHNALDKVIGAAARSESSPARRFVAVTSRASVEMVQKTAMARVGMLVAVSAPTALAVRTAKAAGLALAGFARDGDLVCYAFPERFGFAKD